MSSDYAVPCEFERECPHPHHCIIITWVASTNVCCVFYHTLLLYLLETKHHPLPSPLKALTSTMVR